MFDNSTIKTVSRKRGRPNNRIIPDEVHETYFNLRGYFGGAPAQRVHPI